MSKLTTSADQSGILISDAYHAWLPSQTWLAEMTRTTATRMFAQANLEDGEGSVTMTVAVHKSALTAQVSKIFGALFDEDAPRFSVSWIVDLLVHLGDLGDIGHGYYIPRESRVVRLTEGLGRIAGGLPLELSEHSEGGIKSLQCESIGRVVRMAEHFAPHDRSTEYSELFEWTTRNVDRVFSGLCEGLPERAASPPPEEATSYYNAQHRRTHSRGDRWENRLPNAAFVVARTGSLPAHYSVYVHRQGQRGAAWFEVTHEEARKWVLLAEKLGGSTNRIPVNVQGSSVSLFLPDMLPKAWTTAIFACVSNVVPAERGWLLEIQVEAKELLEILLRGANIELI